MQNWQKSTGCNTLVTFEPENLFYLTGFWGEAIGILDKDANATIIAPELEVGRAKDESINCNVVKSDRGISSLNSLNQMQFLLKQKQFKNLIELAKLSHMAKLKLCLIQRQILASQD